MLMRKETDETAIMAGLSLRIPADLKDRVDDLAASAGMNTSEILIQLIQAIVDANSKRIEQFRELAKEPLALWSFATEE